MSTSAVVSWEKGKFSPRKDKIAQLSDLAKKGKEDVGKLLEEKGSEMLEEKPRKTGPVEKVEKPKVKAEKRGGRRKGSRGRKEKK